MKHNRQAGSAGEDCAAAYLIRQGYEILERNYRCRQGEIDLIAADGSCLVFVEVKYRSSLKSGLPEEAVDRRKQQRIAYTARCYLYTHGYGEETPCRFDVVSITGDQIRLIRNAFSV